MKNKVNRLSKISSLILILFLSASCSVSKPSMEVESLSLVKEFLKLLEEENSTTSEEESSYIDLSAINKDLYDVLSYKERSIRSQFSEENSNSKINFSLDDDWKSIPDSGKIEKKEDISLIFSLKGAIIIGELDIKKTDKKEQKVTLESLMGGKKEVKNFKYLVLSLSSKKSGKLKIDSSDVEKLKGKKIDFKKEPEAFVKDSDVEKVLEGKKKASQEEIFGYDVDESVLVKNLKDKLERITSADIKNIDGITESVSVYASDVSAPDFASNPYKISDLSDIEITYVANSIQTDDIKGFLSYEVHLAVPRLENGRKIKVSYSGFKSTSEEQNKLNSITADDIKLIDGITPNSDIYPIAHPEPKFNSNPYTIKGLDGVTIKQVARETPRESDVFLYSGRLHYKIKLSYSKLVSRTMIVLYSGLRSAFLEGRLYSGIDSSQIKPLDSITEDKKIYPSTISAPTFNSLYKVNNVDGIKVVYVDNSLTPDDNQGLLSYKVKINFPYYDNFYPIYKLREKELTITYTGFKRSVTFTTLEKSGGSTPIKLTNGENKVVAASNGNIEIWNVTTSSLLKKFKAHNKKISSIDISSDDSKIVSVSRDVTIKIWDFNGNLLQKISPTGIGLPDSVDFSPDDTKVVTGVYDRRGTFKVFNVSDGSVFQTFKGHTHYVNSVKFSSNNTVISGSADKKIKIWNISDGSVSRTIDAGFFVYDLDVSSDGSQVAAGGWSSSIKIWDVSSGSLLKKVAVSKAVTSLKFSSDDKSIVLGDYGPGGYVKIWKISDASLLKSWKAYSLSSDAISGIFVDISSDNRTVFSSSPYGKIKVWKDIRGIPLTQ